MSMKKQFQFINILPLIISLSVFGLILFFNENIVGLIVNKNLILGNVYNAIFGWSSIQTGFLFSVYGFIASKSGGLI